MSSWYKHLLNSTFRDAQRNYLIAALHDLFPAEPCTVLDIGAGNGEFAYLSQQKLPHVQFSGVDVIKRGEPFIPITLCDGGDLPFPDRSFDYAMLINMLHHTEDPAILLREAARVTRRGIIIKDHYANNWLDNATLTAMEYANPNAAALWKMPMRFYSKAEWEKLFADMNLQCTALKERFPSYGPGWDLLFGRNMHFIGRYSVAKPA